jgi:hypothetical protein
MENNPQTFIVRTDRAGVFFCEITERRGSEADIANARRIYYWRGAATCSQIAVDGVLPQSQLTLAVPTMTVLGVIEIIPCSEKAAKILNEIPVWKL